MPAFLPICHGVPKKACSLRPLPTRGVYLLVLHHFCEPPLGSTSGFLPKGPVVHCLLGGRMRQVRPKLHAGVHKTHQKQLFPHACRLRMFASTSPVLPTEAVAGDVETRGEYKRPVHLGHKHS